MGLLSFLRKPTTLRNVSLDAIIRSYLASEYESDSVTSDNSLRIATVFACIRVRAESIAQCPAIVYEQTGDSKRRARGHWLYRLLHDQPNEWMTAYEFWELAELCLCLRGNFYAKKIRYGDVIQELIPLPPDSVTPQKNIASVVSYKIDGVDKPLPSSEIMHIRGLSLNGLVGLNPIEYQRQSLQMANAMQRHGYRLFGNAARSGGVLTIPIDMSREDIEVLRRDWDASHKGEHLYSTAILPAGSEWKQMGMTGVDAQFIESRKFSRAEICSLFRVPPHKVMDLEKATFSNIEHQSLEFQQSLLPEFRRIEACVKRDLIPREEQQNIFMEFLADSIVRADLKTRMESYSLGIASRVINPNEARAKENMNPYPAGDEYINPSITPTGGGKTDAKDN